MYVIIRLFHLLHVCRRYNVGCTKRMGLFPNRKSTLENMKKQRALNGNHKSCSSESKKKVSQPPTARSVVQLLSVKDTCDASGSVQKPAAAAAAALSAAHSVHPAQGESSQCSELSGYKSPPSPLCATQPHSFLPSDPGRWNIDDVYEFISSLPGERRFDVL